ncbi:hypothetical protein [Peptoanaerobacter stomatis]
MKKKIFIIMSITIAVIIWILIWYNQDQKYKKYRNVITNEKYVVRLDNKKYEGEITNNYETIKSVPDILELDARIIDKNLGNSFKVGKYNIYTEIVEKDHSVWRFHEPHNPDDVYMDVISGTREFFQNNIKKKNEKISIFEINLLPDINKYDYIFNSIQYKIGNSHGALINISDPDKDTAIIEDVNGNITIIQIYDKTKLDIFDMVANFEVFSADGYRFIDADYRDGIYVDNIVKVIDNGNYKK